MTNDIPRRPYDPARPAIHLDLGYHVFQESEFEQGRGYCDQCGGGPDAAIHKKTVEPIERIAQALERIADHLDMESEANLARSRMTGLERLECWWALHGFTWFEWERKWLELGRK